MRYLIIIDDSEANRGYSPKRKYFIIAKNKEDAVKKVAKKEEVWGGVESFEENEPGEYLVDGFGIVDIIPYGLKKRKTDTFGGVF